MNEDDAAKTTTRTDACPPKTMAPLRSLDEEAAPHQQQQRHHGGKLLRTGVSRTSFVVFLLAAMMAIAGLVFINADQLYIMVDILDYPRTQVGDAAGTLAFSDELVSMAMVPLWGALSDRIARRWVFSLGFVFMALATALHPWALCVFPPSPLAFPRSLLAFRCLFALGGSATTVTLTTLIGDYARESSRARVAGITGLFSGIGALFAALVLGRLPTYFARDSNLIPGGLRDIPNGGATLVITFSITAALLLTTALVVALLLRSPPDLLLLDDHQQRRGRHLPLVKRIAIGISAAAHPLVALAYASGFVARADSITLNLFITPWVDNWMTAAGLCPPQQDPSGLTRCRPAKRLASTLMGISHCAMLLGAPIFGVLSERLGAVNAVTIPAACGMLAFGVLYFLPNPQVPLVYAGMALAGLADIGMIVSSMALMAAVSSPQHRGALSGVYSFFGALGIIVASKLGGFLFDRFRETAPFAIVAVSSGIVLLATLLAITRRSALCPLQLDG